MVAHTKRNFVNDGVPALNAAYFNDIDDALVNLTHDGEWGSFPPNSPWTGQVLLRRAGNRVDVGFAELALTTADDIYTTTDVVFFTPPERFKPKSTQTMWGICSTGMPMIQVAGTSTIDMYTAMGADPEDIDPASIPDGFILVTKQLIQTEGEKEFSFMGSYFLD